jgi:hypothetical protein
VKHLKHPATIIAAVALFIALGGGAVAYAAGVITGSQIKNHSIASKKLTKKAIKQLKGNVGPAGAPGAAGAPGPQGPGGKIINYNAGAVSATPTFTALGTVLGDTLSAACGISSGNVFLDVDILTSDGSWAIDYEYVTTDNAVTPGAFDNHIAIPAASITSPILADQVEADSGGSTSNHQLTFVQLTPAGGSMIWHETATTNGSNTCHLTVQYFPETITTIAGTRHATTRETAHLKPGFLALH